MGRHGRKRPYQLIDDIVTVGTKELISQVSMPETQAAEVMRQIAHQVCFMNAKMTIYIPEALELKLSKRDEDIWAEYQVDGPAPTCARKFSPARIEELATQHNLTVVQIYNILRLMKKREVAARQGVLPGIEPASSDV